MDIGSSPEPDTAGRISIGNVPDINTTYSLHENTVEMIKRNGDAAIEEELETTTTVKLSEKHIQIISKSSLLNLVAVISSMGIQVKSCHMFLTDATDPFLTKAIYCLDSAINAWCMFLIFSFSKTYYDFMCHFPHRLLRKCCKGTAKRIVLRAEDAKAQEASRTI